MESQGQCALFEMWSSAELLRISLIFKVSIGQHSSLDKHLQCSGFSTQVSMFTLSVPSGRRVPPGQHSWLESHMHLKLSCGYSQQHKSLSQAQCSLFVRQLSSGQQSTLEKHSQCLFKAQTSSTGLTWLPSVLGLIVPATQHSSFETQGQ